MITKKGTSVKKTPEIKIAENVMADPVKVKTEPKTKAETKTKAEPKTKAESKTKTEVKATIEKTADKVEKVIKKAAKKKEMKVKAFVEYYGKQVEEKEMIARVKKAWTKSGHKVGDIKEMDLYIKPEENAIYYVINGAETGSIEF